MPKRILQGTVVSDKADKTVTILVTRKFKHPVYKKYVTTSKKYTAHDQDNLSKNGDVVSIVESKPISKTKKWIIVKN
ncbi:MAG: 30S ribosomal protein S17 [Alphaproteobacteria bacterium]|jgi:small subunit ribosomal protein S17|nr:30S ribosomal protein S17 [Alphaproteobacteria bacterium]